MDGHSHSLMPVSARSHSPPQKISAPFTSLDIFPSLSPNWNGSTPPQPKVPLRHRGLAHIPHAFTLPSDGSEKSSFVVASSQTRGTAAHLLDALRNRTLLDLSCMREFSLLRSKPVTERNLSRLSLSSTYNMQTEQLHLQNLATARVSNHSDDTNDKLDSSRRASPVHRNDSKLLGVQSRIAHEHRKIAMAPTTRPDRFKGSPRIALRTFTASPPPRKSPTKARQHQRPDRRPQTESISAYSTQKVVDEQGFLQEQDLALLMSATGYSRAELFARWARFKALCTMTKNSRGVDKETLRLGVPQLSVEDKFFVDRAFDVLDRDGSGALDWPEFIAALSALEKGDASRRVEFLFHSYDLNGDGFIQRQEVQQFFLASLLVPPTPEAVEVSKHFVNKIFSALGREHYDSICVGDALRYLHEHPATDAYSLLGRTVVSTPPVTPISTSRRKHITTVRHSAEKGVEDVSKA